MIARIKRKIQYLYRNVFVERFYGNFLMPLFYNKKYRVDKKSQLELGERILIWNIDSLGDSTWITPVLKSLINHDVNLKITLVHNKVCRELFNFFEDQIELIGIDASPFYDPRSIGQEVEEIRARSFDTMFILEMGARPSDAGRVLGHKLGVENIVSSNLGHLKDICHYVLPENTDHAPIYWPKYFLKVLEPFSVTKARASIELQIPRLNEENTILIHPVVAGYGLSTKMLPISKIINLIKHILKTTDSNIVITSGPGERKFIQEIFSEIQTERLIDKCEILSIRDLIERINRSKLIICNDTSVLHIATSLKKKIITFFGATNEFKIADIENNNVHVLSSQRECRTCHINKDSYPYWPKCIYDRAECLYDISLDEVTKKFDEVIC